MPPAPPPDGILGLRTWSPATYNTAPEGPDDASNALFYLYCGFGPSCAGSGDTASTGFRTPFHKSVSQLSILQTARRMIDQGTYRSSACPYECTRKITRHEVVPSNEANMLSGLGMLGEGFMYPGHQDDLGKGFSRFATSNSAGAEGRLHALHMSHNVTLDQCDDIVRRHELLAPHGVWLVDHEHEDAFSSAERLGDCGLFLGARSSVDADIWRAFYQYARMVLRLGHVDTWLDDNIVDAIVHSSTEKVCNSATSKVCLWWSEFDLDDEEYSCRPKRDASNIVTPSILLATLADNKVAYPPPSPPPPTPPSSPPAPSPPPGAIRCELLGIATTSGYKVPGFDTNLQRFVPVQKKCWRWDTEHDWPPFVAHRDLYRPRDRCSGARSRDVQWDGGFKQSLLGKDMFDPHYRNNDDCPWPARLAASAIAAGRYFLNEYTHLRALVENGGGTCQDGGDETATATQNGEAVCDLGTNMAPCGIRKNLVSFGFSFLEPFQASTAEVNAAQGGGYNHPYYKVAFFTSVNTYAGVGRLHPSTDTLCVLKIPGNANDGKWGKPPSRLYDTTGGSNVPVPVCADGGPGASTDECYYGTDSACGKRQFAFELEDAGPDVPDDSCVAGTLEGPDGNDVLDAGGNPVTYGPNNNVCEDGLMWSHYAPGRNPCAPNTDVTDCGYRPTKRPVRVGEAAASDTCTVESFAFNPESATATTDENRVNAMCSDFSDDLMHMHDLRMIHPNNDDQCGRGTQTFKCNAVADATIEMRYPFSDLEVFERPSIPYEGLLHPADAELRNVGMPRNVSLAHNNYRYHEKVTYINPNLAGQGACVSPTNLLHNHLGELVRPRIFHNDVVDGASFVSEFTPWFAEYSGGYKATTLAQNLEAWTKTVCSDGGEGSVRVPFGFGNSGFTNTFDTSSSLTIQHGAAVADTKFFYDFACPYGSQPEACAAYPREGLKEYKETMDELDQPSGPAFPNCFDEDVPDFECCHATHEFRIHGGPGVVGREGSNDLEHCALPNPFADRVYANEREYAQGTSTIDGDYAAADGKMLLFTSYLTGVQGSSVIGVTLEACKGHCDQLQGPPRTDPSAALEDCHSIIYKPATSECFLLTYQEGDPRPAGELQDPNTEGIFFITTGLPYVRPDDGDACPVKFTSYHHTTTGCKAFCRAAFQRDGDDNTCVPSKPECANWLDANEFPSDQYTTVDTECICGAKLEEFQESGNYVNTGYDHRGTVLQGRRKRALHEDEGVDEGHWKWPDVVRAGIDQFHGKTFSLEHTRTHPNTHVVFLCAGGHFDVGDACIAEIMSFRTDLLNGSHCDDYLDLMGPPTDLVTNGFDSEDVSTHEICNLAGYNDDKCCLTPRTESQASRVWDQTGDMESASVAFAFSRSKVVGTTVHTSRVAAVGNFVRRFATFKP